MLPGVPESIISFDKDDGLRQCMIKCEKNFIEDLSIKGNVIRFVVKNEIHSLEEPCNASYGSILQKNLKKKNK